MFPPESRSDLYGEVYLEQMRGFEIFAYSRYSLYFIKG
jgi:hypothetical protein